MRFRHANKTLRLIDENPEFTGGFSTSLVQAYRELMHVIREAPNENTLRALKSYHFEKLGGKRGAQLQYSMRMYKGFRLIFQIAKEDGGNRLVILAIENYHKG
jgi:plasmid maintenance system killer protein